MHRLSGPVLLVLFFAACSAPSPPGGKALEAVPPRPIDARHFAQHLETLASDAFEGRGPGTPGERRTTAYIEDAFRRLGLQPGNRGEWLQSVPAVRTEVLADGAQLEVSAGQRRESLAYREDMVVNTLSGKPEVRLEDSPVVFAGYGVVAPEEAWDDYAGLDVRGKTVIVLVNDPGWGSQDPALFKGRAMTYYGRWTYKFEEAARQGAAACFIVHDSDGAGYGWDVVRNSWTGAQFDLPEAEDPGPRLDAAGWLSAAAAQRIATAAGVDFEALRQAATRRGFHALPMAAHLTLHLRSRVQTTRSDNVVAVLPGRERPQESVVYTAHWDHLGTDPTLPGDGIYNGAVDNAGGVAGLLAIAEAFARNDARPARSVVFAAVTLEESGLLGSRYYVAHPPFALAATVADINMDALPLIGRSRDMSVIGLGQSDLDDLLAEALAAQGRVLAAEAAPEKGHYFRSDHFSFARRGVPALYAKGGTDLRAGGVSAGRSAEDDYARHRYHTPADEFRADLPLDGAVEDLAALYAVGRRLADGADWPHFRDDSEFRAAQQALRAQGPAAGR